METPLRPEGSPAASSVPSKRSVLLVPGQVSSDTQPQWESRGGLPNEAPSDESGIVRMC